MRTSPGISSLERHYPRHGGIASVLVPLVNSLWWTDLGGCWCQLMPSTLLKFLRWMDLGEPKLADYDRCSTGLGYRAISWLGLYGVRAGLG
jgi:hypothetical protein